MVKWLNNSSYSPVGVDIGSRSVKLLQFSADRSQVCEAARWDLPADEPGDAESRDRRIVEAICRVREGRRFRGRKAVFCIGADDLFVQNIRVAKAADEELKKIVHFEAAGRLPFGSDESEIRYLDAADVRQGDVVRREVILMACRRTAVERILALAEDAALVPVSIDVEPTALLRCYSSQYRRDDDQDRHVMFVDIGASNTGVVIARGADAMFVKYIDIGGKHLDDAVAVRLKMSPADASALRRHNGDRRADRRDPEVTRSLADSIRGVLDKLVNELSLCLRYYSVTFRGSPVSQIMLGGGEAAQPMLELFSSRLDLPCELGNPLRTYDQAAPSGRVGQWDVAAGLAMREVN